MGNGEDSGFGVNGLRAERRASLLRVPEWLGYYKGAQDFPVVAGAYGIYIIRINEKKDRGQIPYP